MCDRNHLKWLLVAVLLSCSVQVFGMLGLVPEPIDKYDSKEYLAIARSISQGEGYAILGESFEGFESFQGEVPTRMRQPGYPFYLGLFYWSLGEHVLIVQLSQIVLNGLTLILTFLVGGVVFGDRLWRGTIVGLALYFPLWLTSSHILTESLFTFLLMLSMFLLQRAIHSEKIACFALSGVVLGIAFLTRPIALPLCLLSLFPICFYAKLRKAIVFWCVLLVAFLAAIFPWFLRNAIVLGDYTPLSTDGGWGFWVTSVKEEEPKWLSSPEFRSMVQEDYYHGREANGRFVDSAIKNIKADPLGYLMKSAKRVVWTWSYFPGSQAYRNNALVFGLFSGVQIILLLSAVFGIFTLDVNAVAYYLLPAITLSCALVFHKGFSRLIIPAMPFVLVLSGQGFWWLKQKVSEFRLLQ